MGGASGAAALGESNLDIFGSDIGGIQNTLLDPLGMSGGQQELTRKKAEEEQKKVYKEAEKRARADMAAETTKTGKVQI